MGASNVPEWSNEPQLAAPDVGFVLGVTLEWGSKKRKWVAGIDYSNSPVFWNLWRGNRSFCKLPPQKEPQLSCLSSHKTELKLIMGSFVFLRFVADILSQR